MRAAIFFTPPAGHPLSRAAGHWLGRNAFDGEPTRPPDAALDERIASPARYGFHATMKAPFRLAEGTDLVDLDAALASFCAANAPVTLEHLILARIGRFFALVPQSPPPALIELESAIVRQFERFRAPLSRAELARREPEHLTERQRENLTAWGYPFVFADFRFHMTLTGPIAEAEAEATQRLLGERFEAFDGEPLTVDGLALFIEPEPGAPFKVHSLHPLAAG